MEGATTAVTPYTENARPLFSGGNVSARIAWAMGCRPPPPTPWMTRDISRIAKLGAIPQNSELNVNRETQIRKKRFRPSRETNQPVIGHTTAYEIRYEVSTQVLSSLLAPMLPAMCGS